MSQFNNPYPQPPYESKPAPMTSYQAGPQPSSSGSKILLIVLAIVFAILLFLVIACGALSFIATRAVSSLGKQFETVVVDAMANDAVQRYQDHDVVQEHIGEIEEYEFEDPAIDLMNRPVVRLNVEGKKGRGKIVFYRRSGRPQKVVLEVDGQEIMLDDNPEEFLQPEQTNSPSESFGFGEEETVVEPPSASKDGSPNTDNPESGG